MSHVIEREREKAKKQEEFDNPGINTDSSGKRIKGVTGVDWLKERTNNKTKTKLDPLKQLALDGILEIQ